MRLIDFCRTLAYKLRQLPHHAYERYLIRDGAVAAETRLSAKLLKADGSVLDLGLLGRRIVTTAGVNYLAGAFAGVGAASNINWHGTGIGTAGAVIGDTALGNTTGAPARVAGTQSTPGSSNIYQSQATVSYTGALAITEWGIFTASTAGTLFDRFQFAAINVLNGDSIQFTFQLTLPSGG